MRRCFLRLVPVIIFLIFSSAPVFGFGSSASMSTAEQMEPVITEKMKELTIPIKVKGSAEIQQIPLFSEDYAQTPVAEVNDEPITLKEFTYQLSLMHNQMEESGSQTKQNYTKMLDRLITIKLIKQEALNIGFDQTPAFKRKVEDFKTRMLIKILLARQLVGLEPDEADVEDIYKQMAQEAKVLTYKFRDQADAEALLEEVQNGADFKSLASEMVADGKAEEDVAADYVKLTELLPPVAKAVSAMEVGDVSELFQAQDGVLLFRLEGKRLYEDPEVRQLARGRALNKKSNEVQLDYLAALIDKYATFNEEAMADLDFNKIIEQDPDARTLATLSRFDNDQRPLVTVRDGDETAIITVSEVAGELKGSLYHGVDKKVNPSELMIERQDILQNKLNRMTATIEAKKLNIHTSSDYLERAARFEEEVLFDTFLAKAVIPGLIVKEEDVRSYYNDNLDDYSTPMIIRMNTLVFKDLKSAQDAQKKLQEGVDFKWLSANLTGLADPDDENTLDLDGRLLTITALPEDLQEMVKDARKGDFFLYSSESGLYYTLQIDAAYPPKAKPYEDVRLEAGKIVYGQVINEALAEWVGKLKEVYETEIFIASKQ